MILVDSNIILDIITEDTRWYTWSSEQLQELANSNTLIINSIIYTEVSTGFKKIEDLNEVLPQSYFKREEIPDEACFLAGKVYMQYKKLKGTKLNILPDFFIGAHGAVQYYSILTRDIRRYKTYFPTVELITP